MNAFLEYLPVISSIRSVSEIVASIEKNLKFLVPTPDFMPSRVNARARREDAFLVATVTDPLDGLRGNSRNRVCRLR
jgi:hypothetical protein